VTQHITNHPCNKKGTSINKESEVSRSYDS
jgi:hypothetical protein